MAGTPEPAPRAQTCPSGLPATTRCLGGQDRAGAFYLTALPANPSDWPGVLVLHAHGGPALGPPRAERAAQDLQRWAAVLRAGHAWAGSTFGRGGVAVQAAAEDTERLRQLFVAHGATPRRTLLHGQPRGARVAAAGADVHRRDGRRRGGRCGARAGRPAACRGAGPGGCMRC